ncbi:predicted protein [Aspergillus terreus NIH2624]|uniref:Uncharacterized protein n=1 Tax=Aspergillus terreus (strain NIH 2624 / FGSC A1156) TaxID=341663 RepID=Q0CBI6_ASPTN|nr:uncharacterized protein ATEG_08948 [Aspergillus terreus NIH2624]EAU31080.1 predicted protein [Aspergillus terreus NIH2624]
MGSKFDHSSGVEAAREVAIAVGEDRRAAWPSMGTPGDGRPGAAAAAAWDVTRVAWIPTGTGETDEEKRRMREDLQRGVDGAGAAGAGGAVGCVEGTAEETVVGATSEVAVDGIFWSDEASNFGFLRV